MTDRKIVFSGPFATWLTQSIYPADVASRAGLARRIEKLPIAAVWIGGSLGTDLSLPSDLLNASSTFVVGTSITNIWRDPAADVAAAAAPLFEAHPGRFVLGVGAGHASQTDWNQNQYHRPLAALASYLDDLDKASPGVGADQRALAALGPKALELAGRRSLGALPWLTTADHTAQARSIMDPSAFLAPGQKVILETDPGTARAIGRNDLKYYLTLPNYVNAWLRLGFTDEDVAGGGTDRLIDAIFAWGTPEQIRARIDEHLSAGADQVCIQPIPGVATASPGTGAALAVEGLEQLAPVLV